MQRITKATVIVLVVAALSAALTGAATAGKSSPTLSLSAGGNTVATSGNLSVPMNGSVHVAAAGLDVSKQAVLYKGMWSTDPSFKGWKYIYYEGFNPASDGTLAVDETQSSAGTYRYQVCQYYPSNRSRWVCTNYAEMTVS
jgi:hypothetical protein